MCAYFHRAGNEERLDYQGRAGSTSIVRWTLCPVIFGVDFHSESVFPEIGMVPSLLKDSACSLPYTLGAPLRKACGNAEMEMEKQRHSADAQLHEQENRIQVNTQETWRGPEIHG